MSTDRTEVQDAREDSRAYANGDCEGGWGENAVKPFLTAFDDYWHNDGAAGFGKTPSAKWTDLGLDGIDTRVGFSPYAPENAQLAKIADVIGDRITSSLFYSLAFLYQTPGPILDAITRVTQDDEIFVYGVSDRDVGLDLQKPDGNVAPVSPAALGENVPEPFKSEPAGGSGNRMHHIFVVIDFDKPTARVYLGSYNFSSAADKDNGENLLLIRDHRVAVTYMVEALRIFDHYHFRLARVEADETGRKRVLATPCEVRRKSPGGLSTTRLLRRFVIVNSSLSPRPKQLKRLPKPNTSSDTAVLAHAIEWAVISFYEVITLRFLQAAH